MLRTEHNSKTCILTFSKTLFLIFFLKKNVVLLKAREIRLNSVIFLLETKWKAHDSVVFTFEIGRDKEKKLACFETKKNSIYVFLNSFTITGKIT